MLLAGLWHKIFHMTKHKKLPLMYLTHIRPQVLFSVCATLSSPHLIYTRVTINKVMLYKFTHACHYKCHAIATCDSIENYSA